MEGENTASVRMNGKLQGLIDVLKQDLLLKTNTRGKMIVYCEKGRMVVGDDKKLRQELLKFFHASAMGGHSGVHATSQKISRVIYWKGLSADIRTFIRECHVCQQSKYDTAAYPGLLQPLEIPNYFWEVISMDFIEGLPKSQGFTTILVVVDKLSKFGHFIALKHPYTAAVVAQSFMYQVSKLYGMPTKIISDRTRFFEQFLEGTLQSSPNRLSVFHCLSPSVRWLD